MEALKDFVKEVVSTTTQIATGEEKPCHSMHKMRKHHPMGDNNHHFNANNVKMNHDMHHGMNHGMSSKSMDHDMPNMKMCKMSMTFNSDYENLCILTDKLMVTTKTQLVFAMIAIVLFCMGYEYFKLFLDQMQNRYIQLKNGNFATASECKKFKTKISIIYALNVGYSMIIMLLFMTFNTWIMLSVSIGAGLGHYIFDSPNVSVSCH